MNVKTTTEQSSNYQNLQDMTVKEILTGINNEDSSVPAAVAEEIPQIEKLVEGVVERMKRAAGCSTSEQEPAEGSVWWTLLKSRRPTEFTTSS